MKRFLFALLALLLLGAAPAVADDGQQTTLLLSPTGQPVGGKWQAWMNESRMPTFNGPMVLDLVASGPLPGCMAGAQDCTTASGFTPGLSAALAGDPETVLSTPRQTAPHWSLLYEQAHVVDLRYLTDADRAAFLRLWHRALPSAGEPMSTYWWQGEQAVASVQQAPGEWFSADYALCALFPHFDFRTTQRLSGAVLAKAEDFPGLRPANQNWQTRRTRWEVRTQQRSCRLIRGWLTTSQG